MTETTRRIFAGGDGLSLIGDVGGDPSLPPVLLLHGGGQTRHSWQRGAQRLIEEGFHVAMIDARGHGESDWSPDGDYSFQARARDVRAIADAMPSPPALVGASMGGLSAIAAIGTSPGIEATALVLVDVTPRVNPAGAQRIVDFMLANPDGFASLDEAAEAIGRYNPTRPRSARSSGLRRNLRQRDGRWFWHWDPAMLPRDVDPAAHSAFIEAAAAAVPIPTLLVRGGRSDVVREEEVASFRRIMPHAEYADVAGAGHMAAGDRNDPFIETTIRFLLRHHRAAGSRRRTPE